MNGGDGDQQNWLLIKERDDHAVEDPDALTQDHDTSVKSGRTMSQIAEADAD
jgi:bifunctional non-homologous end joining protein LigD